MLFHAPSGQFVIAPADIKQAAFLMHEVLKNIRKLADLPLDRYERDSALDTSDFAQIYIIECAKSIGIDLGVTPHDFNKLDLRD
jgi:hypothetical protein